MFDGKNILITGGTGSFGQKLVETILARFAPNKLAVFSRDELKQFQMAQRFPSSEYPCMRYFIGDVRDQDRLYEALHSMDVVIHAAAMKQVPTAEYNPFEAIKTNVLGGQNVIRAAINQKVKQVIALSTDKAASPINLYGATKLCSDKLFVAANAMSGKEPTRFSVVRYGNVVGSRGSVIPFFLERRNEPTLPITDPRMTRFSITLQEAVDFVLMGFRAMRGGEIFVPKIPSYRITDLAEAIAPQAEQAVVGIRPGEKLHECMVTEGDAPQTVEFESHFVIAPNFRWWKHNVCEDGGTACPDGFSYTSGNNPCFLSIDEIRSVVNGFCREYGREPLNM